MPSARIEIDGQFSDSLVGFSGGCNPCPNVNEVKICRSYPDILNDIMSEGEWIRFCEVIDRKLELVQEANKTYALFTKMMSAFFLIMVIAAFVANALSFGDLILAPVSFACFLVVGFLLYRGSMKLSSAINQLSSVCDEWTSKLPGVSFHIRDATELNGSRNRRPLTRKIYLEVETSTSNVQAKTDIESVATFSPLSPSNLLPTTRPEQKTAVERLMELDEMKPHLTNEEYEKKRSEILYGV